MKSLKFLITPCLVLFAANAHAENTYIAADLMFLDMNMTNNSTTLGANPTAMQARVGSVLHKFFAVEGAVALGANDDTFNDAITGELKTLFSINALGRLPLGQNAEVFGKVGMAKMDIKVDNTSYDDTGALYGIGIGVSFSEYSSLSMEYDVLPDVDIPTGKVETTSINISYRLLF
jgi:hypothetical protein